MWGIASGGNQFMRFAVSAPPRNAKLFDRARFRVFRDVRIESGLPEGTDVR